MSKGNATLFEAAMAMKIARYQRLIFSAPAHYAHLLWRIGCRPAKPPHTGRFILYCGSAIAQRAKETGRCFDGWGTAPHLPDLPDLPNSNGAFDW